MNTSRKSGAISRNSADRVRVARANTYIFCDKKTGAIKFTVEQDRDGHISLDRAAGSLAVFCVAHYCSPNDFVVAAHVDESRSDDIRARALALLETARVGVTSVALSPREREVLRAVTSNLCNKEIAFHLSISVRTVKFHVSALLAKFGVQARAQLSELSTARLHDANHSSMKVSVAQGVS